jgi:hypothetical protein
MTSWKPMTIGAQGDEGLRGGSRAHLCVAGMWEDRPVPASGTPPVADDRSSANEAAE